MLWRAQLRSVAKTLLTAALESADATVISSRDQPAPDDVLPSITIWADDKKRFDYTAPVQARTDALVTIEIACCGDSKDEGEALLDSLCETVENTLFGPANGFVALFEQIDSCETFVEFNGAKGRKHFFGATVEIRGHTTEVWDSAPGSNLSGLNIYVDSVNVFDAASDFAGKEPFAVAAPAPRTQGPDGRPEAAATIDLAS